MSQTNFTAWLNLQPPVTPERLDTVIVHGERKYVGEAMARVTKNDTIVAEVPVRSTDRGSRFEFQNPSGFVPIFRVSITQAGQLIDRGTITRIDKVF